jgi:hypothetical protein
MGHTSQLVALPFKLEEPAGHARQLEAPIVEA